MAESWSVEFVRMLVLLVELSHLDGPERVGGSVHHRASAAVSQKQLHERRHCLV